MTKREYRKHTKALLCTALLMSEDGLQVAIKAEWKDPKWPAMLFDAMCQALEIKMGKRAYYKWLESLDAVEPEKEAAQ